MSGKPFKKGGVKEVTDGTMCKRIGEGELYIYTACDDGTILRARKRTYTERECKPFLYRGAAHVCIYGKSSPQKVDTLIAKAFIPGYKPGSTIIHKDGNPLNCAVSNLLIARKSGVKFRNRLCVRLRIDGVEYPSLQSAAKILYVAPTTLHNAVYGKHNPYILAGVKIEPVPNG
jgi:hypothetical protein